MNLYDENGNKVVVVRNQTSGGSGGKSVLTVILVLVVLYMGYQMLEDYNQNSGGAVMRSTTEQSEDPVILSPNLVETAEALIESMASDTPSPTLTPVPEETRDPSNDLMYFIDGGLPPYSPYTLEQVQKCEELIREGVSLKSPQRELCDMYTAND